MSVLKTDRLILRPFQPTDAHAMYKNWTYDKRVARYCRWHPHSSIEITNALLEMYLGDAKKGFDYRWGIVLAQTDELIGAIDVVDVSQDGKEATLGYVLSYDYWNMGFATEALKAVIHYLFEAGFSVIKAEHHIDNVASGRVMEKSGMQFCGCSKAQEKFGSDKLCQVKCYQINNGTL